jgi:hypothetical protein
MSSRRSRRSGRLGTGRRDWLWILTFVIVGGSAAFLAIVALSGGSGANEPAIAGIECERNERLNYHVHSRLELFIGGEPVALPANIGIKRGECLYWLHTHEGQPGIIHVEAPSDGDYTLGQFFAVWGQSLSTIELMDRTTDAQHQIRATVGPAVYQGDPATIPLEDGTAIRLEYGPPFLEG